MRRDSNKYWDLFCAVHCLRSNIYTSAGRRSCASNRVPKCQSVRLAAASRRPNALYVAQTRRCVQDYLTRAPSHARRHALRYWRGRTRGSRPAWLLSASKRPSQRPGTGRKSRSRCLACVAVASARFFHGPRHDLRGFWLKARHLVQREPIPHVTRSTTGR